MLRTLSVSLSLAALMATSATAQLQIPMAQQARLAGSAQHIDGRTRLQLVTTEMQGNLTMITVSFDAATAESGPWPLMFAFPSTGPGLQVFQAWLPDDSTFDESLELYVRTLVLEDGQIRGTNTDMIPLGLLDCDTLDFNMAADAANILAGECIDEQWAALGVHISGVNNAIGMSHPDKIIAFDSGVPSAVDPDLMTPGGGVNNTEALGMLLIIPQNPEDVDPVDGLVDVPNDENAGGEITFDFDTPQDLCGLKVVDIDNDETSQVKFWAGALQLTTVDIPNLGNNSVAEVVFFREGVTRMTVCMSSSGGLAELLWNPEDEECIPQTLNFEGQGLVAGRIITGFPGVSVEAENDNPNHPDQAILFNTSDVTGEDDDLATPGYHPTNTMAERHVLIIAEDVVDDLGGDGLVDDPDDEAWGGVLRFSFDVDHMFLSATVLDIDETETASIKLYAAGEDVPFAEIPLASLGDNSSQTVMDEISGVRVLELCLSGSGALAQITTCPEGSVPGTPGTQ